MERNQVFDDNSDLPESPAAGADSYATTETRRLPLGIGSVLLTLAIVGIALAVHSEQSNIRRCDRLGSLLTLHTDATTAQTDLTQLAHSALLDPEFEWRDQYNTTRTRLEGIFQRMALLTDDSLPKSLCAAAIAHADLLTLQDSVFVMLRNGSHVSAREILAGDEYLRLGTEHDQAIVAEAALGAEVLELAETMRRLARRRLILLGGLSLLLSTGITFVWRADRRSRRQIISAAEMAVKLAEERADSLWRSREMESIIEAMSDGVHVVDLDGNAIHLNAAAKKVLRRETVSGSVDEWAERYGIFHKDEATRFSPEEIPMARALRGETVSNAHVFIRNQERPDGVHVEVSAAPVYDHKSLQIGALTVFRDITRRMQAQKDRAALEIQLYQAQKLESIGQLAAGIAHEINTPTQYVGDNTRFLSDAFNELEKPLKRWLDAIEQSKAGPLTQEQWDAIRNGMEDADVEYLCEEIPNAIAQSLEGLERVSSIVLAMKSFSHPAKEMTAADLNKAIESTVTVSRNEWKYVAELETAFDPDMPLVDCLVGDINQVVLNIIVNAAHAIAACHGDGEKGRILVATRAIDDVAEIVISDDGGGIPESIRDRIFDPFFTTKPVGKGTGQGLSLAHNVVTQKHDGTITVDSVEGIGTTFTIRIPID